MVHYLMNPQDFTFLTFQVWLKWPTVKWHPSEIFVFVFSFSLTVSLMSSSPALALYIVSIIWFLVAFSPFIAW